MAEVTIVGPGSTIVKSEPNYVVEGLMRQTKMRPGDVRVEF